MMEAGKPKSASEFSISPSVAFSVVFSVAFSMGDVDSVVDGIFCVCPLLRVR